MKFNSKTSDEVKKLIESLLSSRKRVRIWYGDTETGLSWNEEHYVLGYIGKSTGYTENDKIPLIVNNSRSLGGPGLLDHCVIRIDDIKSRKTLYKHDNFKVDLVLNNVDKTIVMSTNSGIVARFKTEEQAQRYVNFMHGERYNK